MNSRNEAIPTIAVVYTGGTIGMRGDSLEPMTHEQFIELLSTTRGFARADDGLRLTLPSPEATGVKRRYVRVEFQGTIEPLDSSEMIPKNWADIAIEVDRVERDTRYSGVVVLHGTDTMAWTASALSFLLGTLRVPVILTGAQSPLSYTRTDALRNLVTALEMAAEATCPVEVCIFFDQLLMRGNRSTKVRVSGFDGFDSHNFAPLGTAGTALRILENLEPLPPLPRADLAAWKQNVSDVRVLVLRAHPGLSVLPNLSSLRGSLSIILEGYGSGTAGRAGGLQEFLTSVRKDLDATIVLRTQVQNGAVEQGVYEAADWLKDLVVPGSDITSEACVAKLLYLMASGIQRPQIERAMRTSLCGEATLPTGGPAAEVGGEPAASGIAHYVHLTDEYRLLRRLESVLRRAGLQDIQHEVLTDAGRIDLMATGFGRRLGVEWSASAHGSAKALRDIKRLRHAGVDAMVVVGVHFTEDARRMIEDKGGVALTWDEALAADWSNIMGQRDHGPKSGAGE